MCSVQTLISTAEGGKVGLHEDLIVRKDFRGKGIGAKLLAEVFRWCETYEILRLQLLRELTISLPYSFMPRWDGATPTSSA